MNQTFTPATASPPCFGKEWSASAPECAGGPDPAYTHPTNGTHRRDQCAWYQRCGTATASSKARYGQVIPPSSLLKHAPPQVPPLPRPAPPHPFVAPQYGVPTQPAPTFVPHAQQTLVPPWIAQMGPQLVPVVYSQPGSQMPAYLSVPEPVNPNEHWLWRLLREVVRSIFKSSGHTTASFFDHNPMRGHAPPNQPPTQNT